MVFEVNNFKEVIELIPKLKKSVELAVNRELEKKNQKEKIINMDRRLIRKAFSYLQGKWTIDILFIIFFLENPYFNEIRKSLPELNSRTLTTRLKHLEKEGLINRNVHTGKPVQVSYTMTPFGKNLTYLAFPPLIYIIMERPEEFSNKFL